MLAVVVSPVSFLLPQWIETAAVDAVIKLFIPTTVCVPECQVTLYVHVTDRLTFSSNQSATAVIARFLLRGSTTNCVCFGSIINYGWGSSMVELEFILTALFGLLLLGCWIRYNL